MKKALLTTAAIAAATLSGMANEYKFVFDGNNDMGGLTRQTSTKEADLTFADSFSLSEDGIELTATKASESGLGFALINAGGDNAGLCVYSSFTQAMTPEISVKAPGGKITSIKMRMSGTALSALDIPFNGKDVQPDHDGSFWFWEWNDKDGAETVSYSWQNTYYARYIHSIDVVYTPDLGGKQECGLSFASNAYEAILGESFSSPSLKNPNKLDLVWTSSDNSVATVDEKGKVTLVGRGNTIIKAATEGNEEFAAGNASYELTVIPSASDIKELLEFAPALRDRVKVNFPATVTFARYSTAFVVDSEGNAACFEDIRNKNSQATTPTTIYSVGQVIPAGWIATNATMYESVIWEGLPDNSTETVDVTYAKVSSVTPADADRVVILKNVTFEKRTAEGTTKAYGTTPDGTVYEFQDTYDTAGKAPGTYDVTCVVRYSKVGDTEYFFLAPIAYSDPSGDDEPIVPDDPTFPNHLDYTLNGETELPGVTVREQIDGVTNAISFTGECEDSRLTISFATPEGWDSMMLLDFFGFGEISTIQATRAEEDWMAMDAALTQGFKPGNSIAYDADGEDNFGYIALVKDDKVYLKFISFSVNVKTAGGNVPNPNDPIVPESLVVTVINDNGLEVSQYKEEGALTISITGTTADDEVSVVLDVPEGWDGFISMPYDDSIEIGENGFDPRKTRSEETYWCPIEDLLEDGFMKGNRFTFKANGTEQEVATYLYKDEEADMTDWIYFLVNIAKDNGSGVESVDKAASARYYNLQGAEVANPTAGVYVKVIDGKATKVIVK